MERKCGKGVWSIRAQEQESRRTRQVRYRSRMPELREGEARSISSLRKSEELTMTVILRAGIVVEVTSMSRGKKWQVTSICMLWPVVLVM